MPRALAASASLVLLAVAGSAGCSADAGTRSVTVLRRDSAGIAIVETPSEAWADDERWSVDPEPRLVIGLEEGDAAYLWGEIVGVTRLRDGSFVVADRQPPRSVSSMQRAASSARPDARAAVRANSTTSARYGPAARDASTRGTGGATASRNGASMAGSNESSTSSSRTRIEAGARTGRSARRAATSLPWVGERHPR